MLGSIKVGVWRSGRIHGIKERSEGNEIHWEFDKGKAGKQIMEGLQIVQAHCSPAPKDKVGMRPRSFTIRFLN